MTSPFADKDLRAYITQGGRTQSVAPMTRPPDVIYTFGKGGATCCLAVQSGFGYGINSEYGRAPCPRHTEPRHRVLFVDNPYRRYRHEAHLQVVATLRPRYATVRDMMTPEQCHESGIDYYEPRQILDWAAELREHAERVIVVPKAVEYLDQIPDEYAIGIPVPSQYGAEALPLESYRGRRCHLLGGAWSRQLSYLYLLGDDVASLDMNYIHRIAMFGQYVDPAGQTHSLKDLLPFDSANALYIAFSISCGAIRAALAALYDGDK